MWGLSSALAVVGDGTHGCLGLGTGLESKWEGEEEFLV